jgi:hypothetical protein
MNFGKLLAAGKSFVNGRAEISYRVNKQIYLPKFESPKNPFAHLPKAQTENLVPVKKENVAAKTQKMPTIFTTQKPATTWTSKLNPISILRPAPVETKNERPIMQTELSLDAVKVVHNDLTDADVEIVPMKSRPAPPELQPARKSWEILGERLLKATAL